TLRFFAQFAIGGGAKSAYTEDSATLIVRNAVKRLLLIVPLVALLLSLALPAAAQDEMPVCNPQLPPRLGYGVAGIVTRTANPTPVRVREQPSTGAPVVTMLDEGSRFIVMGYLPTCADGITWWQITTGDTPYA